MSPEHSLVAAFEQARDEGAFSWRKGVVGYIAHTIWTYPPNPPDNAEQAKKWIQSPEKAKLGRLVGRVALAAHNAATPKVIAAMERADGAPGYYIMETGFPGLDREVVSPISYAKPRTLKMGTDRWEIEVPFRSSIFNNHKKNGHTTEDPRIHSEAARKVRARHLDELAQAVPLANGDMALVGPRGYTAGEQKDINLALDLLELFPSMFPDDMPKTDFMDYRSLMSDVRPKPAIAGLYAEFKKDMSFLERLLSDILYLLMATPKNDAVLIAATIKSILWTNGGSR